MSPLRARVLGLLLLTIPVGIAPSACAQTVPAPREHRPAAKLDFGNTYGVIVGVLHWEEKSLTPYSTVKRKDQELYDALRRRGVPADHLALLLDEKATLANIRQALQKMAASAKPESTLIFYYAGHGWRTGKNDTAFANYDYRSKNPEQTAFAVSEITATLKARFKGKRVLLFADCCHSGGLGQVAQHLAQAQFQAAALTSADALCVSTNNWTFTQTLVDGFQGEPYLDDNGDGTITLAELAGEVSLAMQFREQQRSGHVLAGMSGAYCLAPVNGGKKLPATLQGPFAVKEFVAVRAGATQRTGRILDRRNDLYTVEFFTYNDKQVSQLPATALSKIKYRIYKVGDTVTLTQPGMPRARVVEVSGAFHRVAFPGQPLRGEEWVLSDRIVDDPRTAAEVEWKGQWYPAIVLKKEGARYFIHYLGHEESWNEWVEKDRIRFPGEVRNPFGVRDVPDPTGEDIKQFAAQTKLPGGPKDKNAAQWVQKETAGKADSLEGDWSGRWDSGSGTATIKVVKDRIYVLYTDTRGDLKGKTWLLEAVRVGKHQLMGRWAQVGNPDDSGPYVGLIVDPERIDGTWGGDARWDFRRKLKK